MTDKYCWMFGVHKGNPCPCGYPDNQDMEVVTMRAKLDIVMSALTEIRDRIPPLWVREILDRTFERLEDKNANVDNRTTDG